MAAASARRFASTLAASSVAVASPVPAASTPALPPLSVAAQLCSSASDKTREAATSLLREAYVASPAMLDYAKARPPAPPPQQDGGCMRSRTRGAAGYLPRREQRDRAPRVRRRPPTSLTLCHPP